MGLRCKRCGSGEHVKNGLMRGEQRDRCKACGLNFTDTPPRGMPLRVKVTAVLLYLGAQEDLGTTRYFAAIRHERGEGGPAPAVLVPMDQIVTADCRIIRPEGNLYATGSTSCIVLKVGR